MPITPRKKRSLLMWVSLQALEGLALVLAVVGVLLAGLSWRLAQGPLNINMARPAAAWVMQWSLAAERVDLGDMDLVWNRQSQSLGVRIHALIARDDKGRPVLVARQLDTGLSLPALLRAKLVPGHLRAEALSVVAALSPQGRLRIAYQSEGPPKRVNPDVIADVLLGLIGPEDRDRPISFLRQVDLGDLDVHFRATGSAVRWTAHSDTLRLVRDVSGVQLRGKVSLTPTGRKSPPARIAVDMTTQPGRPDADIRVQIDDLHLAQVIPQIGGAKILAQVDAPLQARIHLENTGLAALKQADIRIDMGAGMIRHAGGAKPLNHAHLRATHDSATGTIAVSGAVDAQRLRGGWRGRMTPSFAGNGALTRLDMRLDQAGPWLLGLINPSDPPALLPGWSVLGAYIAETRTIDVQAGVLRFRQGQLAGRGQWVMGHGGGAVNLAAASQGGIPVRELLQFWPHTRFPVTRRWMDQALLSGDLHDTAIVMKVPPRVFSERKLRDQDIRIAFAYRNARVAFLRDATPITMARGRGVMTGRTLNMQLDDGRWSSARLNNGVLRIPEFGNPDENMTLSVRAAGPAGDLLTAMNSGKLKLADRANLVPARLSGQASGVFTLVRPLKKNVTQADLRYSYDVDLKQAEYTKLAMDFDSRVTALNIRGDEQGLVASGTGLFGPIAGTATMRVPFAPGARRETRLVGQIDASTLKSAGLPAGIMPSGAAPTTLTMVHQGGRLVDGRLVSDLTPAQIALPAQVWQKAAGAVASFDTQFSTPPTGGMALQNLVATGPGLSVRAAARFDRQGQLQVLDAPQVLISDFAYVSVHGQRTGDSRALIVQATGKFFDARSLLARTFRPSSGGGRTVVTPRGGIGLVANIQQVRMADGREVQNLRLSATFAPKLQRLDMTAGGEGQGWDIAIAPNDTGLRVITAKVPDAGLTTQILTGIKQVRGGRAEAKGTWAQDGTLKLDIDARDVRVRDAPALATLLSVASIGGLANALGGEGIVFNKIHLPLTIAGPQVQIGDARATGPGLGVTTTGTVDTRAATLDLEGTLAPAYGVNAVLGNIPLLGKVLVSREGEGIVGFTYTLDGPVSKPRAFVNPLSALAPGVLRRLFEGSGRAPAEADDAADKPRSGGNPNQR